jgi:hypothetical protein
MNLTILLPLLVCAVGMVAYMLAGNAKAAELGRLAFFAGLLVALMALSGKQLHVGL